MTKGLIAHLAPYEHSVIVMVDKLNGEGPVGLKQELAEQVGEFIDRHLEKARELCIDEVSSNYQQSCR